MGGCATILENGLRELADDGGPPRAGQPFGARLGAPEASFSSRRPAVVTSGYQYAPTIDWHWGRSGRTYTPGHSLFRRASPTRYFCQAVPVGLSQAFSGPTGPAGSSLARIGPFDIGVAGPEGAVGDIFATDRNVLTTRAFTSGERMAGEGPSCGTGFFLYVRIGRPVDAISVLR